jgi:hypothetical protein
MIRLSPDDHRDVITSLWIKKQGNPKQMNISDDQQPSGDKRIGGAVGEIVEQH